MTTLSQWMLQSAMPDIHCLQHLAEGDSPAAVHALLGAPAAESQGTGLTTRHYHLHDPRRGWTPWMLVFDGSSGPLLYWFVDAPGLRAFDDLLAGLQGQGGADGSVHLRHPQRLNPP